MGSRVCRDTPRQIGECPNRYGWDTTSAIDHLGPFALTETLATHLSDGANVVFICSAVEDPDRRFATMAGSRGGRYISAEASARGEWNPGAPDSPVATPTPQWNLATVLAFAREMPRLRFNGIEPGLGPGSDLGRDANVVLQAVLKYVISPVARSSRTAATRRRPARMITGVLTDQSSSTGVYYDENGRPMQGSALVRDPDFDARVVAETRSLVASVSP